MERGLLQKRREDCDKYEEIRHGCDEQSVHTFMNEYVTITQAETAAVQITATSADNGSDAS